MLYQITRYGLPTSTSECLCILYSRLWPQPHYRLALASSPLVHGGHGGHGGHCGHVSQVCCLWPRWLVTSNHVPHAHRVTLLYPSLTIIIQIIL